MIGEYKPLAAWSCSIGLREVTLTNIPSDKAQTITSEIDKLIDLADTYADFVLGALLCTVRDYLRPIEDQETTSMT